MKRVIVVGGFGFFGGAVVELLRAIGVAPLIASRRATADLQIDAEDPASLRAGLRREDIVVDTAGPFQNRTTALVEAAMDIRFDVIDISDSLDYTLRVDALRPRIEETGIRVLTSCSSVSTVVAALVRRSGVQDPVRVSVFLSPAAKETASSGTGGSLQHSLGRTIRVLRGGRLVSAVGWRESRPFQMPPPIGRACGYLMESVHALTLPRIWPSLREADFWVDSRVPGLNLVFSLAARVPVMRWIVSRLQSRGLVVARLLGSKAGGMLVEIEGAGAVAQAILVARRRSYLVAVAPAVLVARALSEGRFEPRGLVPHDRHVDPEELVGYLSNLGVTCIAQPPRPVAPPNRGMRLHNTRG